MSKKLFSSFAPYVCRACQARIASSRSRITSLSKQHYSSAQKSKASTDNEASVERRIASLGGKENVHQYYGHSERHPSAFEASAGVFNKEFRKMVARCKDRGDNIPEHVKVYGRVTRQREFGKKLGFVDIATTRSQAGVSGTTQITLDLAKLQGKNPGLDKDAMGGFLKNVKRGDWIVAIGAPSQLSSGEWGVRATEIPQFMAPALQPIPLSIKDQEFRMRHRHADQIVHPSALDIVFFRHKLLAAFRHFLTRHNFVEVTTPMLQANAGGAIARPFETIATEFSKTKLNLRVAPELFLKRLIIGGVPRVYEIGPAFRNEGVDATHNPEFTICEFYGVMLDLPRLKSLTEQLFRALVEVTVSAKEDGGLTSLKALDTDTFQLPFKTIQFIPSLGDAIRQHLPDWKFPVLEQGGAFEYLLETFHTLDKSPPANPTIPRLLDALSGEYLEPQCVLPTFVTHQPECMAPLARSISKAFPLEHEHAAYRVSARAELFITGREYVNCYEEENSPFEQRRKFEEQLKHKHERDGLETHGAVDENYLAALEWGMPQTGGWGCGIDRLMMLFSGKDRIADVLPFGTLRNVVGLGSAQATELADEASFSALIKDEGESGIPSLATEMGTVDKLVDLGSVRENRDRTMANGTDELDQREEVPDYPTFRPRRPPSSPKAAASFVSLRSDASAGKD